MSLPLHRAAAVAASAAAVLVAEPAAGQVLASERASVTQVVNGATLTVEYYRPAVRGRTIFGKLVHWGETWTPGANWATTLETDRDLRVDGQPLPKGKYSLWLTPRQDGAWTMSFSAQARRFHLPPPKPAELVLRVPVRPVVAPDTTERLTWSFPSIARDSAVLQLRWATTMVPLHLAMVRPPAPTMTAAEAAPYAGRYRLKFDGDTLTFGMRVYAVPGGLEAVLDSIAAPPDLGPRLSLVPTATPHRFHWGTFQNGQFIGIEENLFFVFPTANGRATGVEALDTNGDVVYARGALVPEPAPPRRARR